MRAFCNTRGGFHMEMTDKVLWPLERALVLKIFEKMQAISLYWFAAEQQTCTLTLQIFGFFYVKFSAEFNDISLFFWKQQEKV